MDGNEDSQIFNQLLEQFKQVSDSQALSDGQNNEDRLIQLQRQAQQIQGVLNQLQVTQNNQNSSKNMNSSVNSSMNTSEIYQNLGPLMGSGLRNAPALPPKQGGKNNFWIV